MGASASRHAALPVTLTGSASMASAMGVGRFAFTPLLPLMQADAGLTLGQGAWLASANYAGYFVGALACAVTAPAPGQAARLGLAAVALFTLLMGLTADYAAWLVMRFGAGIASAYVLVGVSARALPALARSGLSAWAGWVFAGVGIGIGLAGLVGLVAGLSGTPPDRAWLLLGLASAAIAVLAWTSLREASAVGTGPDAGTTPIDVRQRQLILAYGSYGFGYIVPATFLPAMARDLIADPAVFGWIWPAFGLTAAASTVVTALCFRRAPPRRLWAVGQLVMAGGVLAPALHLGLGALLLSAVCVGGTFMVIAMAGMQEARRLAGAGAQRLMAAMTAAFALGQLAGPFIVGLIASSTSADGITTSSLLAAALLLAGAWGLRRPETGLLVPPRNRERKDP